MSLVCWLKTHLRDVLLAMFCWQELGEEQRAFLGRLGKNWPLQTPCSPNTSNPWKKPDMAWTWYSTVSTVRDRGMAYNKTEERKLFHKTKGKIATSFQSSPISLMSSLTSTPEHRVNLLSDSTRHSRFIIGKPQPLTVFKADILDPWQWLEIKLDCICVRIITKGLQGNPLIPSSPPPLLAHQDKAQKRQLEFLVLPLSRLGCQDLSSPAFLLPARGKKASLGTPAPPQARTAVIPGHEEQFQFPRIYGCLLELLFLWNSMAHTINNCADPPVSLLLWLSHSKSSVYINLFPLQYTHL